MNFCYITHIISKIPPIKMEFNTLILDSQTSSQSKIHLFHRFRNNLFSIFSINFRPPTLSKLDGRTIILRAIISLTRRPPPHLLPCLYRSTAAARACFAREHCSPKRDCSAPLGAGLPFLEAAWLTCSCAPLYLRASFPRHLRYSPPSRGCSYFRSPLHVRVF